MIFTDRTIIVQKGISSINDTIILYRGDKGVEIRFTLNEGSPFRFGSGASPNIIEKTEAAYGQLIIKRPNDLPAVFSEVAPTNEGKIVFTITAEMIDEITEVGNYTFQIRLLDESRNSRATLPEVVNGIEIREPIATEDVTDTNEVGVATVGYALTTAATAEDAFDSQGNYNKTTWGTGDRITAAKLNKIEAATDSINKKANNIPTKTSQLENDNDYATITQVNQAIDNAQLGGGEVDLSGYVTKETGNANQITFADGQTFQAKLDAGTLKGDKGDPGEQGPQGPKGDPGSGGGSSIDDATASATTTYSSNKIESIKENLSSQIPTVPTNVSEFTNDAHYASETFVANKIAEAQLGGGSTDLSKLGLTLEGQNLSLTNDGTKIGTNVNLPITAEVKTKISKVDFEFSAIQKDSMIVGLLGINTEEYNTLNGDLTFKFTPTQINNVKNIAIGVTISESFNKGYSDGTTQTITKNTENIINLGNKTMSTYLTLCFKINYESSTDTNSTGLIELILSDMSLSIGDIEIDKINFEQASYMGPFTGEVQSINIKAIPIFTPTKLISRWNGKKYLAIGDSITESITDSADTSLRYPEKIGRILGCKVNNIGSSGQNISSNNNNVFPYKRYSYNYDLITIALGVNDSGADGTVCEIGTIDSMDTTTFMGAYNAVLTHIFKCNPFATVVLIPPIYGNHQKEAFVNAVKEIGKKYNCPVFNVYELGINNINAAYYMDNARLHINEQGHTMYANKLAQFLCTI